MSTDHKAGRVNLCFEVNRIVEGLMCCRHFSLSRIYLPPATKLWQGNVFTPVCQSFCSQGRGSLSGRPPIQRPPGQKPPWTETPPGHRPPWTETPLDREPNRIETPPRQRRPLDRDPPPVR